MSAAGSESLAGLACECPDCVKGHEASSLHKVSQHGALTETQQGVTQAGLSHACRLCS